MRLNKISKLWWYLLKSEHQKLREGMKRKAKASFLLDISFNLFIISKSFQEVFATTNDTIKVTWGNFKSDKR